MRLLMYVRDLPQLMQTYGTLQHLNRPWLPPSTFGLLTVLDLPCLTYAVETAYLRNDDHSLTPCHSKLHTTFSDPFPVYLIPREIKRGNTKSTYK